MKIRILLLLLLILTIPLLSMANICQAETIGNSATIQALIDSVPSTGGLIELSAGKYIINSTIKIPGDRNIKLCGQGSSTILYNFKYIQNMIKPEPNDCEAEEAPRLEICDLSLLCDCSKETNGIYVLRRHNVSIHDVYMRGKNLKGIIYAYVNNSNIESNYFTDLKLGIKVYYNIDNNIVSGNNVSYASDIGIDVYRGNYLSLVNNTIEECGEAAIRLRQVNSSLITGNMLVQTYYGPNLFLVDSCDNAIGTNVIAQAGAADVYEANTEDGAVLINSSHNAFTGNVFSNIQGRTLYQRYGVYLDETSSYNKFVGSIFARNASGDYLDEGMGNIFQ